MTLNPTFYDQIDEQTKIPDLLKHPTTRQLVKWAGASGDFNEIHYDKDFALSKGLPGVIVHGRLKAAFLGQMITDWVGEQGVLKKLTSRYHAMDFPGETLVCKGKVARKYKQDNQYLVECDVWTEGSKGKKTTSGIAVVLIS